LPLHALRAARFLLGDIGFATGVFPVH
jgi:hypothetical protein